MWLWVPDSFSLLRFPMPALAENHPVRGVVNSAGTFLIDRDGSGWMMTHHEGIWRIPVADKLHGASLPAILQSRNSVKEMG